MKDSRILESFFEEQHRRWRRRAYTFIHSTCQSSPHPSDYGEWLRLKNANGAAQHRAGKKTSH